MLRQSRCAYLNLDVEHRVRADLEPERLLDVLRQTLLVALLHRSPLLQEQCGFSMCLSKPWITRHSADIVPDHGRNRRTSCL